MAQWGVAMSVWDPLWYPPGAAANSLAASSYQKECRIATARSNCCCASAEHEIGKWTLSACRSDAVSAAAADAAKAVAAASRSVRADKAAWVMRRLLGWAPSNRHGRLNFSGAFA